ncbi:MAG: hypothetical protein ILO42_03930, partial [Clostridia bacterium]|nr:hypothetical protein [Clostridia bacterium]
MAQNTSIKPAHLAKALALKTKDITDIFAEAGLDVKAQTSLDAFALDLFWEKITKANQIVNINDYICGQTAAEPPRPVSEPVPEEKTEAKKPEPEKKSDVSPAEAAKQAGTDVARPDTGKKTDAGKKETAAAAPRHEKQPVSRTAGERFESRLSASSAKSQDGQKKDQQKRAERPQKRHGIEVRERTGSATPGDVVSVEKSKKVVDTRGSGAN